MKRNKTTGMFSKPLFELILHDFGNLAFQIITISELETDLKEQADALNRCFEASGRSAQFKAEVLESNETRRDK